jgi:hypothetical protein
MARNPNDKADQHFILAVNQMDKDLSAALQEKFQRGFLIAAEQGDEHLMNECLARGAHIDEPDISTGLNSSASGHCPK